MAGHSKWKQIKHKKAASDAKKSKVFTKLSQLISSEAKKSNGDTNSPGLRTAVLKARAENMPSENIERAIKKAAEQKEDFEHITYEGYGPGGVGIIIEALTTSRNRAAAEIKHIFSKHGGNLGAIGSVTWSFKKEESEWIPTLTIPLSDEDTEKLSILVDALEDSDEVNSVYTNAE
jgi:YebC/PmpR family DNA-binding regulatory protein